MALASSFSSALVIVARYPPWAVASCRAKHERTNRTAEVAQVRLDQAIGMPVQLLGLGSANVSNFNVCVAFAIKMLSMNTA